MGSEELEYRKEQAVYYMHLAKNWIDEKRSVIPPWVQIAVVGAIAIILFNVIVSNCSSDGGKIRPNSNQTIISTKPIAVPNLVDMEKNSAQKKLSDSGFLNVQIQDLPKYGDANGTQIIISQNPSPGSMIKPNDPVTIQYGNKDLYEKSTTMVNVPDVTGQTLEATISQLRKQGFINLKWVLPSGYTRDQVIITGVTPSVDTQVNLTDTISLSVAPGFVFDDVKKQLEDQFTPYSNFSSIENNTGRDIKLTLAKKDPTLTTEKMLNESARSYKVTIEHILNTTIGNVTLVNPGVSAIGDASKAEIKNTKSGLTLTGAEAACENKAGTTLTDFSIDWTKNLVQQKITNENITISGNGQTTDENGNSSQVVVYCVVSGSDSNPNVTSFSSN